MYIYIKKGLYIYIFLILEIVSHYCGDWHIEILQGKPAGQRPRKELRLQSEPESCLEAEFLLSVGPQSSSLKAFY